MDSNASFLLACNDVREGKVQEALTYILGRLRDIPEIIVQRVLLPELRAAAQKSDVAQQQWFFKKDDRPQILEVSEAPLTSIYGSRIACWTFFQSRLPDFDSTFLPFQLQQPVMLTVKGHGPSPVCARVSAVLNDLATERNCPSDLLLAGIIE